MLAVSMSNTKPADVSVQRQCGGSGTGSTVANTMLIVRYISHSPILPQYHGWPHVSSRRHCGRHKNRTSLRLERVRTAMLHLHLHRSPRAQAVSSPLPLSPLWAGVIRVEICKTICLSPEKEIWQASWSMALNWAPKSTLWLCHSCNSTLNVTPVSSFSSLFLYHFYFLSFNHVINFLSTLISIAHERKIFHKSKLTERSTRAIKANGVS